MPLRRQERLVSVALRCHAVSPGSMAACNDLIVLGPAERRDGAHTPVRRRDHRRRARSVRLLSAAATRWAVREGRLDVLEGLRDRPALGPSRTLKPALFGRRVPLLLGAAMFVTWNRVPLPGTVSLT